tara:strand:- start:392 stop:1510 length:1119 start_codon:yes stop_codon:yes gene_type:complete
MEKYDVVIIGAGPAGIGMSSMLKDFGIKKMLVVEKGKVGQTFDMWPEEMRFITPSFTTNFWGQMDLNSIATGTSPAFTLETEHPSGKEYAKYLRTLSEHFELPIKENTEVENVEYIDNTFIINIRNHSPIKSKFLIWAAGEYQYPNLNGFQGSHLCCHNSKIKSWKEVKGNEFYVIGGNESGIDAAINLSKMGKKVTVFDEKSDPNAKVTDPSETLTPYTVDRLMDEITNDRISLVANTKVSEVRHEKDKFIIDVDGENSSYKSDVPPILANGFISSLSLVEELFDWHKTDSYALLNEHDESRKTPGLFLVGPQVRHEDLILCFIYKYRQRFGVVANAIGERLGMDTSFLDQYREDGLYKDDLGACGEECPC